MQCGLPGTRSFPVQKFMNERLRQTFTVTGLIFQKSKTRIVLWISAAIYFFVFLLSTGDLGFHKPTGLYSFTFTREPISMLFKQMSPFRFEGIAIVQASAITFLFSPVNLVIALLLSILVGLNIVFSYLAIVAPRICYGRPGVGIWASLPGLLSGWACCGPIILIILGVQASASLIALFGWLFPIATILLVGTLVFNAGRTNIEYLREI